MQTLSQITDRKFEVDVVVGGGNLQKERVKSICTMHSGFYYHCNVDNIAELMAAADLAIGAGGTATWERCSVGTPSIVIAVADNQKELAEAGALNGLFFSIGELHASSPEKLLHAIQFSLNFPETLQYFSANGLLTVDAKGSNRVINLISPPQITIRSATFEDCDAIYEWRNAQETRRYIFDAEVIPLDTHRKWYCSTLNDSRRILLIGETDNKPVGVLRYDLADYEALVSVYLVPGVQGQGIGSQLLRCGSQWVRENHPHIKFINAEIFRDNIASLRAFESAGYKEHHLMFQEAL
ncbi:MAG: GNAT family N-acetyltransferase [Geobacteraceae bacterium]|nr:GNAT family N-acetyltransferase [Geobacteraceae bacterium]